MNKLKHIILSAWNYIDYYFLDIVITAIILFFFTYFPKQLFTIYNFRKKNGSIESNYLNKNPEMDWSYIIKNKVKFKEINILCKGDSLNKNFKKINKSKTTFAINFEYNLKNFRKLYGITSSPSSQKEMFRNGFNKSFLVRRFNKKRKNKIYWTKIYKPYLKKNEIEFRLKNFHKQGIAHRHEIFTEKHLPIDSGIISIMSLAPLARKINIYGWDHYFRKDISKYNYFQTILEMCRMDGSYPVDLYGVRRRNLFIVSIFGLYYFSKVIKIKKYNIKSNLQKINNKKLLLKKINFVMN